MKIRLLMLLSFSGFTCAYGQKFETSFQIGAGAYNYTGKSATPNSNFISNGTNYYTSNIYGNKADFSYGAAVQSQYIAKSGFIVGLQAGYDLLRSYETISQVYPLVFSLDGFYGLAGSFASSVIPVKGHATLQSQSINLNPYIGYRIKLNKINFDLIPGADIALNVSSYDKGKAIDDQNTVYRTNNKIADAPADFRLKFGAAASWKKWTVTVSYAHGLTNMDRGVNTSDGSAAIAHSQLLRFGIGYQLF